MRPLATLGKTSEFIHQGLGPLRMSRFLGFGDLPEQLLHPPDPIEFTAQVLPFLS